MIDAKYLAGFFDGEGCVGVYLRNSNKENTRKYYVLVVSISQIGNSGRDLLQEIQDEFGGSIYRNSNGMWYYTVSANKAYKFLQTIKPFCKIKSEQISKALEFQDLEEKTETNSQCSEISSKLKSLKKLHIEEAKVYNEYMDYLGR